MQEKLNKYKEFTRKVKDSKQKDDKFFRNTPNFDKIEPKFWKQLDTEVSELFDCPEHFDDKSKVFRYLNAVNCIKQEANESLYYKIVPQFEEAAIPTQLNLISAMCRSAHEHSRELINCLIFQEQASTSQYCQALYALSTISQDSDSHDTLLRLIEHSFQSLDAADEFKDGPEKSRQAYLALLAFAPQYDYYMSGFP